VSIAGITDIGSTLYAARIDAEGHGRVVSNSLPFSDRWLLEGLIAELLIPWNEPDETCRLYRRPDDTYVLACKERRTTHRFIFDGTGTYRQFHRLRGSRLLSRAILEWDDGTIPKTIRIDLPGRHYKVTRERAARR